MWLFDPSVVEGAVEGGGVALVLGEGGGEAVGAVHFVAGAEVDIVGFRGVEDGFDGGFGGEADGCRGEAGVEVSVEGGVGGEVFVEDAAEGEVADGVFDGGVGLEGHAALEAVEVDAGNEGFFGVVVGFFLDDGGEDYDFTE